MSMRLPSHWVMPAEGDQVIQAGLSTIGPVLDVVGVDPGFQLCSHFVVLSGAWSGAV
tara:strand:- start:545 stop:715 length:171 start_codon:yes stop_codon:yes gene_type:complete